MGRLTVGRRGLQNPCDFGLFGLTGSLFVVDVKPLALCRASGLGRDCKF